MFVGEETENLENTFELFPGLVIPPGRSTVPRYGLFLETGQQRAVRLRWQPRADREIFLVLNRLRDADGASDTEIALRGRFNFRI